MGVAVLARDLPVCAEAVPVLQKLHPDAPPSKAIRLMGYLFPRAFENVAARAALRLCQTSITARFEEAVERERRGSGVPCGSAHRRGKTVEPLLSGSRWLLGHGSQQILRGGDLLPFGPAGDGRGVRSLVALKRLIILALDGCPIPPEPVRGRWGIAEDLQVLGRALLPVLFRVNLEEA